MNVRIRENSRIARLAAARLKAGKVAIVFGNTIHLHNTSGKEFLSDQQWVCHELQHVEQYRQYGFAGFLTRYLISWVKDGYYNNRFEKEARANENNTALLQGVIFLR